jgi:2-dehydropantoate 2-reductase
MKPQRLFFMGAGAIGSYLGGFLARAGHDVTLVDMWPEHVEAICTGGLAVAGPHDPFVARPAALHVHEAQKLRPDFDIVFIAMKSYDTAWSTRFAARFLADGGYVVSAQNCWNDPAIAAIVGADRAVALVMSRISVAVWEPGKVERGVEKGSATGYNVFRAGEHDGRVTPRVTQLAEMLSVIDASQTTDNIWGERWAKLSQNSMGNPVQAMSGMGNIEVARTPRGREITIRLAAESARVGLKLGYKVPKFGGVEAAKWAAADRGDVYEELDAMLTPGDGKARNWRASMAQDVAKGRRSEIDFMNGYVVARGIQAGVPTPVSAAVVDLMHDIDAGRATPGPANIDLVLQRAGY